MLSKTTIEETYDVEETFTTTESVPGSAAVTSTVTATQQLQEKLTNNSNSS